MVLNERYPFISINNGIIEKMNKVVDNFLAKWDEYNDTDDFDKQSHGYKHDLKEDAYECKGKYEKLWDELNTTMKNALS